MTRTLILVSALTLGTISAFGQAAVPKVGIINMGSAIFSSKEGQKAMNDLQGKFTPKKTDLENKQKEIDALKVKYSKGANALSADERGKLERDINAKTTALNRDTQDAQEELDQENQRVMQEIGQKVMVVVNKYAAENGYSLILDVSSQQSPVLFAVNDITQDIVKLFDANNVSSAPAAAPAKTPAASRPPVTNQAPPVVKPAVTTPPAVTPAKK